MRPCEYICKLQRGDEIIVKRQKCIFLKWDGFFFEAVNPKTGYLHFLTLKEFSEYNSL